jgi:hypothetical protein
MLGLARTIPKTTLAATTAFANTVSNAVITPTSTALNNGIVAPITSKAHEILSPPPEIIQARASIRDLEPQPHWDVDYYTVDGIDVPRYISEAKDPIVEFHFCTGFNSTPLVYAKKIDLLNKLGISCFATKLLQAEELGTGDPEDLIQFHLDSTENFFTSSRVREHNKGIIKVAGTHSASGGYVSNHMTYLENVIAITQNFPGGILHIAPFFDMANASKRFNSSLIHNAFVAFAKENPNLLTSDSLRGKGYSAYQRVKNKEPQVFSADKDPTYGEILALRGIGDQTIERLEANNWQPTLRQRFALPTKDSASCSKTGGHVADLGGAEKTDYDAHHNPELESQKNVDRVTGRVAEMGHNAPQEPITAYTKPKVPGLG